MDLSDSVYEQNASLHEQRDRAVMEAYKLLGPKGWSEMNVTGVRMDTGPRPSSFSTLLTP